MNRKILISYFRKNEANSRLTLQTHWKGLTKLFIKIFVKNMQATLLWDCIPIGRSKLHNSTNQSIAILLKFTYNVKNRKLFYYRFVEPSECTKRPKLVRVCTVIKGPNRTQSAFKAQFIYRTFRRLLRVATSLQLFIFYCCENSKYILQFAEPSKVLMDHRILRRSSYTAKNC